MLYLLIIKEILNNHPLRRGPLKSIGNDKTDYLSHQVNTVHSSQTQPSSIKLAPRVYPGLPAMATGWSR